MTARPVPARVTPAAETPAEWLRRTREEQGLPERVSDHVVDELVRLVAPGRLNQGRVEDVPAPDRVRQDGDLHEQGGQDRLTPVD